MSTTKKASLIVIAFVVMFFTPFENEMIRNSIMEGFLMLSEYAKAHVLLCLIPAFFIAGAISIFISSSSILKYLGGKANKIVAYSVASVSGTILSVCSCTVLPIFAGIHKRGAGLGPAIAFLYSGPAINILAIILTARVLGLRLAIARTIFSISFAIVIGLIMSLLFKESETEGTIEIPKEDTHPVWKTALFVGVMIMLLVFLNWGEDKSNSLAFWNLIFRLKFFISAVFLAILPFMLFSWFRKDEIKDWLRATYDFALLIMPLLFGGVFIAGLLLGRPSHEGLIPTQWVSNLVGGNSVWANFFASVAGAFMYFATLTEVPIVEGLKGAGMGEGPSLALLLAGPALSLPNMLVIRSVLGTKKTIVFVMLVVVMSTFAGVLFGYWQG